MNTVKSMYEWKNINWRKVEKDVFKLQQQIYRASIRKDVKAIHKLQRLLLKSWSAKCLAVRKVTQDNKGKKTTGIDGIKALTPKARVSLVIKLNTRPKTTPIRRVWIPKRGTTEKRPLGIPTIHERARQTLVKFAIEPQWEAKFEPNSYGFRPGRGCHDAIQAIHAAISKADKYFLETDINKCFDKIHHQKLLDKLNTYPSLKRLVREWLKAGILEGEQLFPTEEGTPQGGPLSPLLANIALHGMEELLNKKFPESPVINGKQVRVGKPRLIRYADDLVVLHKNREIIEQSKLILQDWLKDIGLELKSKKTRIGHTLNEIEGKTGFEFLGFQVRQYRVGKYKTGKMTSKLTGVSKLLGFKTLIKPSKQKLTQHYQRLSKIIDTCKSTKQAVLVVHLNPIITGWCNYFRIACSKETFNKLDHLIYGKLRRWAKRRHPMKNGQWVAAKYWRMKPGNKWEFTDGEYNLIQHAKIRIQRHTQVRGHKSPYDGDWKYWSSRMGRYPTMKKSKAQIMKRQKGKCNFCGLYFKDGDIIEIDHIRPRAKGGKNIYNNLQLLHRHCHDIKSTYDKGYSNEEPCEGNLSRTVLQPSIKGDFYA